MVSAVPLLPGGGPRAAAAVPAAAWRSRATEARRQRLPASPFDGRECGRPWMVGTRKRPERGFRHRLPMARRVAATDGGHKETAGSGFRHRLPMARRVAALDGGHKETAGSGFRHRLPMARRVAATDGGHKETAGSGFRHRLPMARRVAATDGGHKETAGSGFRHRLPMARRVAAMDGGHKKPGLGRVSGVGSRAAPDDRADQAALRALMRAVRRLL